MPSRTPPWQWHQNKDDSWDHHIASLIEQAGFGREREYFGIETPERAREVRQKMVTAGNHLGVSVKAFWKDCAGCQNGGPVCRFHVYFTAYDRDVARAYAERKQRYAGG